MQKYINNVAVKNGARVLTPLVGGLVTVTTIAGAAAVIYDANGGLPRTSPLLTDINGAFSFYAPDGRYTITITGAGIVPITISDVLLEDPVDGAFVIVDGAIVEAKIGAGAVTTAKIIDGAVTVAKLADNAVTTAKINASAVTTAKLADDAVTNAKVAAGIDASKISTVASGVGAVAQSAQTRFRERITPEAYGCTPGEANSTVNFRKALTAAAGRTLWLEAGEYMISPSEIPSGITIIGQGMRLTRIKMLGGSTNDLLYNLNARDIVLSNLTLDGNNGACANGRVLKIVTNPASDGPALIMEDVAMEFAPISGEDGQSSAFFSGLAWVHMKNIRYVNNKASMWLSTVDSTFDNLFLGNTGVAAGLPGLILGGSSNKFTTAYFGGNGADRGTGASQVKLLGASNNEFIGCTNDSANGHCYEFIDEGANVCSHNRIIGGSATNASQNAHNTYQHIRYSGNSHHNTVIGTIIGSDYTVDPFLGGSPRRGNFAVGEVENANNNYHINCPMLAFGTQAIATNGAKGSRFIDCPGLNPQGPVNVPVTASPMTYTNSDSVDEMLYIAGGTVSLVTKNGIAVSGASNVSIFLAPTEAAIITYTAAPVVTADRR